MKKTGFLVLLLLLLALPACGAQTPAPPANSGSAHSQPDTSGSPGTEPQGELSGCYQLLGKSDAEAASMLEGSEQNLSADGETVLGRTAPAELFGESTSLELVYDSELTVVAVSINLMGTQYDTVRADLEADFGAPREVDETGELGSSYLQWISDNREMILTESYGTVQVQMSLIQ